jgi:uncharacterized membrane protein YfcA
VVLFAVWCFLVALAGGLVGLVLGNLRLPATVFVASSAAAGGGANLAISAIAALTAAVVHIRARRINWRLVGWMAPPSVAGAVAGGYLAGTLPDTLLLLVITVVLVQAGVDLLRRPFKPQPARPEGDVILVGGAASVPGALLGSRLTGRLSEADLVRAIGVVLLVAAAGTLAQAVT